LFEHGIETHPDDAAIEQLRIRTIYLAGARALEEFRPDKGTPVRRAGSNFRRARALPRELRPAEV
jgi:hypothetical protein